MSAPAHPIHAAPHEAALTLPVERIRRDFPILGREIDGRPLVYLDNAATTQKPYQVIDAVRRYYEQENANIHRGAHALSELATQLYEDAREKIRRFVNAESTAETIFVRGTTEAINLVAATFGRMRVQAGDEVLITEMEHHSNIVPWQLLCQEKRARLRVVPMDERGNLHLDQYSEMLNERTRMVALTHVSNALGTALPIRRMIELAHARGIPVLVDGAQSAPHLKIDVRELDCDFYAFSGHKLFGPTGIGILYGKREHLEAMPPYQGGGDMIDLVTFEGSTWNALPYKFEAGTPHIAGAIGLGAAVDYLNRFGMDAIATYEQDLLSYATTQIKKVPGLHIVGMALCKASLISFVMDGAHASDIGAILDREGIAIRTGHHCAQPVMRHFGVPGTARASLAFYNTREEIDALVRGLHKVNELFG